MTTASSLPTSPRRSASNASKGSSRWLVAGLLVLAAIPLTFGVLRLLQLVGVSDIMPPAVVSPVPLILHIVGASLYAVLGAFQFSTTIRHRWPSWHRAAGRTAIAGALLVAVSALWLTALYATRSTGGLLLAGFRILAASAMLISLGLGVSAVLRRDIPHHREWMTRSYALGLGAATQVLVLMAAGMITGGPLSELNRALLMGLAWGINIVVAEGAIRRGHR